MTDIDILKLVNETSDELPDDILGFWETTEEEDNYYNSIIEELGIDF